MSKHAVIAGSLSSIREMVHKCNKHKLYIQQWSWLTEHRQKDTYRNPAKGQEGR